MKTQFFAASLLLFASTQSKQVSAQSLEEQNKKLKQEVETLKHDNDYFRKTLNILQSDLKATSSDNIEFQLISCIGSKADKTVSLEFLITNKEVDKAIQFSPDKYATGIDLQGNSYETGGIKIGTQMYASTISQDVPLKFRFGFNAVDPAVAVFKLVSIQYFLPEGNYGTKSVKYKDVQITWK